MKILSALLIIFTFSFASADCNSKNENTFEISSNYLGKVGTPVLYSSNDIQPNELSYQQPMTPLEETPLSQSCCRICRKGKACGNSCISRSYTCRKPPGCACDG